MKVCGIELQVGEEPPQLWTSHKLAFNDVFLRMFEAFEKNPNERVVFAFNGKHAEDLDSLTDRSGPDYYSRFGYLLCSKVWKVCTYNQLVTTKKLRESYKSEYSDTMKKRTLTIVEPTSLGIHAYETGMELTVTEQGSMQKALIGIGKPYTTHRELWEKIERMAKIGGVARTRIEKWSYEFKRYCEAHLLTQLKEEAEKMAIKYARQKIAAAPTRHGKRNRIKEQPIMEDGKVVQLNHSLAKWMDKKQG